MPTMRLPDGWAWVLGDVAQSMTADHVTIYDGDLITDGNGRFESQSTNLSVALAVIRSANLDPVYEAAKALFTSNDAGVSVSHEKLLELKMLIESLEVPT